MSPGTNLYYSTFAQRAYTTTTSKAHVTFSNQSKIPRLPIPDLELTAARYKRSLLPLLSAEEHVKVSKKVDQFFGTNGLAQTLQKRLHALDDQETALGLNWLDRLWLQKGYLEYRIPTLINVNWWNQFRDPVTGLGQGAPDGQVTDFQLKRSAGMIAGLIDYSNRVNK